MSIAFYIVGVGRSGTSLLQSILSSHSKICLPPETGSVRSLLLSKKSYIFKSGKEFVQINKKLRRLGKQVSLDETRQFNNEIEFYKFLLVKYCGQKNIIGDKDPRLVEYIWSVVRIFPQVRFIHMIRDPRDILWSKKNADWSKNRPGWYHTFVNYIQLKLGAHMGRELPVDHYSILIYEKLLANPQQEIARLCSFLGVEFEEGMLRFQKKAKELVAEDEKQWKKETMGPLLQQNIGKWEGKLPVWEVALTEKLCQQAFTLGGYSSSHAYEKLSFLKKIKVGVILFFFRIFGIFYMKYRIRSQKRVLAKKYAHH